MILNDASFNPPASNVQEVVPLLADVAKGMAELVHATAAHKVLRLRLDMFQITCAEGANLYEATQLLRLTDRDASNFFQALAQKAPLLVDLEEQVVARFRGAEQRTLPGSTGDCLLLCALTKAIAVSFPLVPVWDKDELDVQLIEIDEGAELEPYDTKIDNLARSGHASRIRERSREKALSAISRETFWRRRQDVYPTLLFGQDVEQQIRLVDDAVFEVVRNRLNALHTAAATWRLEGGVAPKWPCKVTPETANFMSDPQNVEARTFLDYTGVRRVYEWHARCGNNARIHLRFDPTTRRIEIGYIGRHL